jgi:hypothetical protein
MKRFLGWSGAAIGVLLTACAPAAVADPGLDAARLAAMPRTDSLPGAPATLAAMQGRENPGRLEVLTALLSARGIPYELHRFENASGRGTREHGHNIVVTIGRGERDIVLGAHYDAVRLRDGSIGPGIIDNAAGAVMLVHAADALRRLPPVPYRIRVVLFDMEEIGLLGSAAYIREHGGADRVAAMINVDVAGYGSTVMLGPSSHAGNEAVYAAAALVCAAARFDCLEFPAYPPSDDRSFQRAGIPNISIGVVSPVEARQFWLLLNGGAGSGLADGFVPPIARTLHTPQDTVDRVEPAALALAHDMVVALVRLLGAGAARQPAGAAAR